MNIMRRMLVLPLLLALQALPLFAQAAPASQTVPPATLHVESQIVLLDVTVTDASGKPVNDLRPDEFRITENKVAQTISTFEPPAVHMLTRADAGKVLVNSTTDLPKIGTAPVTILVLDELNVSFAERGFARMKVIDWIKRQPEVLPQPTALVAINDKDLHLLRDYTQSRAALLDVMTKHSGDVVWRIDPDNAAAASKQNMGAVLSAIDSLAQATRGIPGRKNILWIGRGFPSVGVSDVGVTDAENVNAHLRYLSDLLMQARVTLSVTGAALDPSQANLFNSTLGQGGAQTLADGAELDPNMSASSNGDGVLKFASLAASSGGHSYAQRNDIDAEIARSVDEGGNYYTISYRPTDHSSNAKVYRKIGVAVTRPGLTVQGRDGYFADQQQPMLSVKETTKQVAYDLNNAATSTIAFTDLHLTAEHSGLDDFMLHASARDLTWHDLPDGRRHADVVLMAACVSSRGKLLARTYATLGSNTEASIAAIDVSSAALPMHVNVPAGTARVRFVVRDMVSGRTGTADVMRP